MAVTLAEVEAQALQLSAEERARLAEILLQSLGEGLAPEIEAAWAEEVERRHAEVERGDVSLQAGPETLAEARRLVD